MTTTQVGKLEVRYEPMLELATVLKRGVLIPTVVHEENGDNAEAAAVVWAKDNQEAA